MNSVDLLRFTLARVTIELRAPMHVGTGAGDGLVDAVFVTDANGLPAVPGTTLAGVLRSALAAHAGETAASQAFGQGPDAEMDGRPSAVVVSWAQPHDASDRPVPFREPTRHREDDVLGLMRSGVVRDRVRIGGTGAVDGHGKFDLKLVPAGARFTFELRVHDGSGTSVEALVALLRHPLVRLGRATRRGSGALDVVRVTARTFDLRASGPEQVKWLQEIPADLSRPAPPLLPQPLPEPPQIPNVYVGTIHLRARSTWRVGASQATGKEPKHPRAEQGGSWGAAPLAEPRITWSGGRGTVQWSHEAPWLVPGAAIAGVLRHRTLFEAARIEGAFLHSPDPRAAGAPGPERHQAAWFGEIADKDSGHPSRVLVEDAFADGVEIMTLNHVSLDRFTQGPLDGHLFDEVLLYGGEVRVPFVLDLRDEEAYRDHRPVPDHTARAALGRALHALCSGRIALGAGEAAGHGRFDGEVRWSGPNPLESEA